MALDREPMKISEAMRIAKEYYNEKTYAHAMRVAGYVAENVTIPQEYRDECIALAIMHDLLEDTEYQHYGLPDNFLNALKLLTKDEDISYDEYCMKLRPTRYTNYYMCAYWVKLADMKDHLMLTDTLNDHLKEKYLSGLRYLIS